MGGETPLHEAFGETTIRTERLSLVPLRSEDAEEMTVVLADQRLHEFIGGRPASRTELSERYASLVAGAGKPGEIWRNWIVRTGPDSLAVGTVQATIVDREGRSKAAIAWVIGTDWQGRGFASEAARGLVGWLRDEGAEEIVAHIHPEHRASAVVARRAGLEPTADQKDGERVWRWLDRS